MVKNTNDNIVIYVKCEKCNKEHDGTYASGRFCSSVCSRSFSSLVNREETNRKVSNALKGRGKGEVEKKCEKCGKSFVSLVRHNRKYCGNSCSVSSRIRIEKFNYCCVCGTPTEKRRITCSDECQRKTQSSGGRKGGILSSTSQKRRSKNEKYFYELCLGKYSDSIHNIPMFNGWDADVITPSLKVAVLWNGVWHRKKITRMHSLLQVKNRDAIKLMEIERNGYSAYIIEDDGAYNPEFVQKEFDRFYGSVAQLVSAALS